MLSNQLRILDVTYVALLVKLGTDPSYKVNKETHTKKPVAISVFIYRSGDNSPYDLCGRKAILKKSDCPVSFVFSTSRMLHCWSDKGLSRAINKETKKNTEKKPVAISAFIYRSGDNSTYGLCRRKAMLNKSETERDPERSCKIKDTRELISARF